MMDMLLLLFFFFVGARALGQKATVGFDHGALQLVGNQTTASILISNDDWTGVIRAGKDLAADFGRVTDTNLTLIPNASLASSSNSTTVIIAGTIGKSSLINTIVSSGKVNVSEIDGQWESFQSQVVSNPIPGISEALVVAGSDKRGTIYGLYDISEQIGVSPWYWWADVPAQHHSEIYALSVTKVQGPPSVKYRGFFLNDEAPALTNWINENYPQGKYGPGYNADFYVHVFELLLRLRANYLWPAEWDSMFAVDDPRNAPLADEYGIVMGSSHTEPMMRWTKEQSLFLNGTWSWATNSENMTEFMRVGVERSKEYEGIYTMGMRGLGDNASPTLNATSLAQIVHVQQDILSEYFTNTSFVPQMWCLYKEVGGYFQDGLVVPEDITLLWADDNWGNAQRLPLVNETGRKGGAGLYYHFDYVGDPRDYKWINTISLQKTWEQLTLTYEREAKQIWIVNVGDLKALEVPVNHYFDMAYDITLFSSPNSTTAWTQQWASREFGPQFASDIADIINKYSMYASRRKYELLDPTVYSLLNYNEADNVLDAWKAIADKAQSIYDRLEPQVQPAFFELVLHPCKAGYTVYKIHITAGKNYVYAGEGRTSANHLVQDVLNAFNEDHALADTYHNLLDGKWNHIMDQTHLGYNYWQQPMRNSLPPLAYTQALETSLAGQLGVSVEGSNGSVAGDDYYNIALSNNTLVLPPIDPYGPATRWIEIYSRGTESFDWEVSPHDSWVTATPSSGTLSAVRNNTDVRILLSIDWANAPNGSNIASINITTSSDNYGNYAMPTVNLPVNKTSVPETFHGFVESDATVSIEAEHFFFPFNSSSSSTSYITIPNYSRTLSGVTLLPNFATSPSPPPKLQYPLYLFTTNTTANITVYLSPALNTNPSHRLKYGISLNNEAPQIVQYIPSTNLGTLPSTWTSMVESAVCTGTTSHWVGGHQVGGEEYVLRIWAVEPGVVFQKIVVDLGGVRESYLGPPESMMV